MPSRDKNILAQRMLSDLHDKGLQDYMALEPWVRKCIDAAKKTGDAPWRDANIFQMLVVDPPKKHRRG